MSEREKLVQVNMRLPETLLNELDQWLAQRYAPLPPPSRTAVFEQWIREGWDQVKSGGKG